MFIFVCVAFIIIMKEELENVLNQIFSPFIESSFCQVVVMNAFNPTLGWQRQADLSLRLHWSTE